MCIYIYIYIYIHTYIHIRAAEAQPTFLDLVNPYNAYFPRFDYSWVEDDLSKIIKCET